MLGRALLTFVTISLVLKSVVDPSLRSLLVAACAALATWLVWREPRDTPLPKRHAVSEQPRPHRNEDTIDATHPIDDQLPMTQKELYCESFQRPSDGTARELYAKDFVATRHRKAIDDQQAVDRGDLTTPQSAPARNDRSCCRPSADSRSSHEAKSNTPESRTEGDAALLETGDQEESSEGIVRTQASRDPEPPEAESSDDASGIAEPTRKTELISEPANPAPNHDASQQNRPNLGNRSRPLIEQPALRDLLRRLARGDSQLSSFTAGTRRDLSRMAEAGVIEVIRTLPAPTRHPINLRDYIRVAPPANEVLGDHS